MAQGLAAAGTVLAGHGRTRSRSAARGGAPPCAARDVGPAPWQRAAERAFREHCLAYVQRSCPERNQRNRRAADRRGRCQFTTQPYRQPGAARRARALLCGAGRRAHRCQPWARWSGRDCLDGKPGGCLLQGLGVPVRDRRGPRAERCLHHARRHSVRCLGVSPRQVRAALLLLRPARLRYPNCKGWPRSFLARARRVRRARGNSCGFCGRAFAAE